MLYVNKCWEKQDAVHLSGGMCTSTRAYLHIKQSAFPKDVSGKDVNIIQSVYAYSVHMFCVPHLKQFLL